MNNTFEILVGSLAALACWGLWFYGLKEQRIDRFREDLFSLRKDLFLLAASGIVSFESDAYVQLRLLINAMLLYGHRITLFNSFAAGRMAARNPSRSSLYHQWRGSLTHLSPIAKEQLVSIHTRMFRSFMNHLVHGSVLLSVVYFVFVFKAAVALILSSSSRKRRNSSDLVDAAFEQIADNFDAQALEEQAYWDQTDSQHLLPA